MFELQTGRLHLRHFTPADDNALYRAVFSDPEVMRFGDGIQSLEWTRTWIQTCQQEYYQTRGYGPYAVIERKTSDLIGYCGLFYFPDINGQSEVEIGYRLARPSWGQGYATEAGMAVCNYAFHTLAMKRLIALIDPTNVASARVAQKLGMKLESEVMFAGYTHPDFVYTITQVG